MDSEGGRGLQLGSDRQDTSEEYHVAIPIPMSRIAKQQLQRSNGRRSEIILYHEVSMSKGETEVPSVAVTKSPRGPGLEGLEVEPDAYDVPADLSSDEEYLTVEEADSSRAARLKKSVMKGTESIKAAFSKENMHKTKDNLGTKFHNLGEKVVPPERREKMHQAGERLKQSGERLKENIAKKAPTKESFRIKLKKERTVAEGQEGAEGAGEDEDAVAPAKGRKSPGVAYTEVVTETKREGPVEEAGATRIGEDDGKEEDYTRK
ncbi:caveolae-associated protein 4a-like [Centroberyx affinis]|uniref:caveolae-associated protein 4a-like n=1 Tax=Centroberyx affinis TaxID=166261 RepID=UPI003A5C3BC7